MAPNKSTKQLLFLLLTILTSCLQHAQANKLKETNFTVYIQDYFAEVGTAPGPEANDLPIVGIPGRPWTYSSFGTIYGFDIPITIGSDRSSAEVGRAQGLDIGVSLDGTMQLSVNYMIFTAGPYRGSTLQQQGAIQYRGSNGTGLTFREFVVLGGTGSFRGVRGYVTIQAVVGSSTSRRSVVQANVTLKHYD